MSTGQQILEQMNSPKIMPSPEILNHRQLAQWPYFASLGADLLPDNKSEVGRDLVFHLLLRYRRDIPGRVLQRTAQVSYHSRRVGCLRIPLSAI
jgi:hypothetical protein